MLTLNIDVSGIRGKKRTDVAAWSESNSANWVILNDDFKEELTKRMGGSDRPKKFGGFEVDEYAINQMDEIKSPSNELGSEYFINDDESCLPIKMLEALKKFQNEKKYVVYMDKFLRELLLTKGDEGELGSSAEGRSGEGAVSQPSFAYNFGGDPGINKGVLLTKEPMRPKDLFENGGGVIINAVDNGRQVFNFTQDGWRTFTFGPATSYWMGHVASHFIQGLTYNAENHHLLVHGQALSHFRCLGNYKDDDGGNRNRAGRTTATQRYEGSMIMESVKYDSVEKTTLMSIRMDRDLKEDDSTVSKPFVNITAPKIEMNTRIDHSYNILSKIVMNKKEIELEAEKIDVGGKNSVHLKAKNLLELKSGQLNLTGEATCDLRTNSFTINSRVVNFS